jgi:hypothetical protein
MLCDIDCDREVTLTENASGKEFVKAMEQIEEKGYAFPYTAEDQQVIKVGVEFSAEKRNVERWMVAKEI